MPTIVVALKNIITDAANPVDLTTLPEDEAERCCPAAADLAPRDSCTLDSYASLLGKRTRLDETIPLFRQATDANPDFPNPEVACVY